MCRHGDFCDVSASQGVARISGITGSYEEAKKDPSLEPLREYIGQFFQLFLLSLKATQFYISVPCKKYIFMKLFLKDLKTTIPLNKMCLT